MIDRCSAAGRHIVRMRTGGGTETEAMASAKQTPTDREGERRAGDRRTANTAPPGEDRRTGERRSGRERRTRNP